MAFCKKCGNEVSDTAKFCNKCGTPREIQMKTPEQSKKTT